MKKLTFLTVLFASVLIITSCDINDSYYNDYTAPAPPTGIQVLNGDNRVDIYWNRNRESDVAGYNVYYNYTYQGKYTLIGSTSGTQFVDFDAVNGNKYYYAVAAYDYNGNESELSYDVIYSTPRPEGFNQSIFDAQRFPNNSGYSFQNYSVVPFDDDYADFFFDIYEGVPYINAWFDPAPTYIRDMGLTNDIYDIAYAPQSGWIFKDYLRAYVGHTYVIWTIENNFAKIRIKSITADRIVFDWAFQTVVGEPQLKPVVRRNGDRKLNKERLAR
ncbi:MAG: hypothetical protein Q8M94_02865 [Ignavibacteria bacterium]|nr:hypothetical protein [Ignavibacteria bacterium]